ncbi:MAG: hypothetical protein ACLQOO_26390, partial [Terriglobia bacterium]
IALETQQVEAEYALYRRDHIELTVWARGALMGADKESSWIIREGVSLDRAIDRKIKLLMGLRKDLRQQLKWEREQAEAEARGQEPGVRRQEPEAEARGPESGVGCQEPEVRSQEPELSCQEPAAASVPRRSTEQNDAPRPATADESPVGVAVEGATESPDRAPAESDGTQGEGL